MCHLNLSKTILFTLIQDVHMQPKVMFNKSCNLKISSIYVKFKMNPLW